MASGANINPSKRNPFNPGFGVAPPRLAGRAALVHTILAGVLEGPGRSEYHTALLGPRGTGKTVLLAELARLVENEVSAVSIRWTGSQPLQQHLLEERPRIEVELGGKKRRGKLDPAVTVKAAPVGIGVEARIGRRDTVATAPGTPSVYGLLSEMVRIAKANRRTLVLLADEIQASSKDDLAQLGVAAQQLTNTQRFPLCVIAAGLPITKERFETSGSTFLERQPLTYIGLLNVAAAEDALLTPFTAAGRRVKPSALKLMIEAAGGYPFALQLVGSHAWAAAGDDDVIADVHARHAVRLTRSELETRVYAASWSRLAVGDRAYITAAATVAGSDGVASTSEIAAKLGRTTAAASVARKRAINTHAILIAVSHGYVQFTMPGFASFVRRSTGAASLADADAAEQ